MRRNEQHRKFIKTDAGKKIAKEGGKRFRATEKYKRNRINYKNEYMKDPDHLDAYVDHMADQIEYIEDYEEDKKEWE